MRICCCRALSGCPRPGWQFLTFHLRLSHPHSYHGCRFSCCLSRDWWLWHDGSAPPPLFHALRARVVQALSFLHFRCLPGGLRRLPCMVLFSVTKHGGSIVNVRALSVFLCVRLASLCLGCSLSHRAKRIGGAVMLWGQMLASSYINEVLWP